MANDKVDQAAASGVLLPLTEEEFRIAKESWDRHNSPYGWPAAFNAVCTVASPLKSRIAELEAFIAEIAAQDYIDEYPDDESSFISRAAAFVARHGKETG